jgi:hypothetical protein
MRERTGISSLFSLIVSFLFLPLLFLLLMPVSIHALTWSEIMFNPLGNDNNQEFVELIGNEPLENCYIRDSASADKIILHHYGVWSNEFILIMENESAYLNDPRTQSAVQNATVYVIGSAIGNGLGNTNESLTIYCRNGNDNTTLLSSTYAIGNIPGFEEGYSIIYKNDSWTLGDMGGTPGWRTADPASNTTNTTGSGDNSTQNNTEPPRPTLDGPGGVLLCNETLQILLNSTKARAGALVTFTLLSPSYASFEVYDNKTLIAAGDTLSGNAHSFLAPNTNSVRIVARSDVCGVTSRMTRYVTILRSNASSNVSNTTIEKKTIENATLNSTTDNALTDQTQSNIAMVAGERLALGAADRPIQIPAPPPPVTSAVVMDSNADVIPWISLFGMVVVIVSAAIFWKEYRQN